MTRRKYSRSRELAKARKEAGAISEIVITQRAIIKQSPYIPAIESYEEEEEAMEVIRDCQQED